MSKPEGRGRTGKPVDDFEDDKTGDTGDDAATRAASAAVGSAAEGDGEPASPGKGHNSGAKPRNTIGAQVDKLESSLAAWEEQQAEIDAILDEAKERIQPYKDEQKAIAKAAAEGSENEPAIAKQIFKAALTVRRLEQRKARTLRKLNEDQRDELLAMAETEGKEGLVPLPLYQWAIDQAAKKKPASRRGAKA